MENKTSLHPELFKKVLEVNITKEFKQNTPFKKFLPYIFYKLFVMYGKGEILADYDYQSDCLTFEIDKLKTNNTPGWLRINNTIHKNGYMINFFNSKPWVNINENNLSKMEICYSWDYFCDPSEIDPDKKPFVPRLDIHKVEMSYHPGRKKYKSSPSWFLTKILTEEVFPIVMNRQTQ